MFVVGGRVDKIRGKHGEVHMRVKLLMTIWWLAHREGHLQVSDRFGTTQGKEAHTIQRFLAFFDSPFEKKTFGVFLRPFCLTQLNSISISFYFFIFLFFRKWTSHS